MAINKLSESNKELHINEQFRIMADCAPVLLWMARTDSLCVFFNKTWLEYTGRTLEQEWGVGWSEGIYFEDFQYAMDTYIAHFNAQIPFEMEYRLQRHDGEFRWILDRGVPYYDIKGNFLGFIGSCIDITENKLAAAFLKRSNIELEQKVQERTAELQKSELALRELSQQQAQFVSNVSHELRTPMTAIKSSLDLIMYGITDKLSSKTLTLLEIANRNTHRLLRLINDILDVKKNKGVFLLVKKTCLLLPLIQHSVTSNELYAEKYQVQIQLGEVIPDAKADVDADRFIQVLDNLLSNAAKFSRPNTKVTVSMLHKNGSICILVKDCGIGISPEFAPKIFSKFMQEHIPSSQPRTGTGLGLNIAKTIIELHQGTLSFETSSAGTTFIIELKSR